nr:immunoglobulin heavy chain junction region [Macaca mulatta]MOW47189.1 immunoglobulin heavy chain junction region [Macaca mulatta]
CARVNYEDDFAYYYGREGRFDVW